MTETEKPNYQAWPGDISMLHRQRVFEVTAAPTLCPRPIVRALGMLEFEEPDEMAERQFVESGTFGATLMTFSRTERIRRGSGLRARGSNHLAAIRSLAHLRAAHPVTGAGGGHE